MTNQINTRTVPMLLVLLDLAVLMDDEYPGATEVKPTGRRGTSRAGGVQPARSSA